MKVYKFSECATKVAPEVEAHNLINQMKNHERYVFGTENLLREGVFRLNGWAFDMREELTLYLVKQYDQWFERYAPNKTSLRKLTYGRIDAIKEI